MPYGVDVFICHRLPHLVLRKASISAFRLAVGLVPASEVSAGVTCASGAGDGSSVLSIAVGSCGVAAGAAGGTCTGCGGFLVARASAAFFAAGLRTRVFAAFFPAPWCLRFAAAFFPAALCFLVLAAFWPADLRFGFILALLCYELVELEPKITGECKEDLAVACPDLRPVTSRVSM
jgi:hypothetical protein